MTEQQRSEWIVLEVLKIFPSGVDYEKTIRTEMG